MSTKENQRNLSEEKEILLEKLSTVFDYDTAIGFLYPKTSETRKQFTIEELKQVQFEQPDERLQRLRALEHYQTTTQSLARADLEASYQAFVRGEVGQQQYSRNELEQFVRNSSDIDTAQRYFDSTNDASLNPLQSKLLYHSSKLNEQRANLLKSVNSNKSLKQINDSFTIQNYFTESLTTHSKYLPKEKETFHEHKRPYSRPRLMHLEHRDKKYCVTFMKDQNPQEYVYKSLQHPLNTRAIERRNIESLFDTETTTDHGLSITSSIHRETFPPLSLSALKEYRPTLTAKSTSSSSSHAARKHPPGKILQKTEFIWEQSIVSPQHE